MNKKILLISIVALYLVTPTKAQDHIAEPVAEGFTELLTFLYFAKEMKTSSDSLAEEYLYRYMQELYTESFNDEFEYRGALNAANNQLIKRIEQVDFSKTYYVYTSFYLDNYDFNKGGFPIRIRPIEIEDEDEEITFVMVPREPKTGSRNFEVYYSIDLKLLNFNDFQFVKVPEQEAKALLKRRKDKISGYIDREVYAIINFTLEKSEVIKPVSNDPQRLVCGKIVNIELYEFEGYKNKGYIGTIPVAR
jgi:hypothetical protein